MTNPPPEWSLRKEVKKRKTQELERQLAAKALPDPLRPHKQSSGRSLRVLLPSNAVRKLLRRETPKTAPASKRASQMLEVVTGEPPERWTRRQRRVAMAAVMLMISVCLFTSTLAWQSVAQSASFKPIPTSNTTNVVNYLSNAGLPVTNLRVFSGHNSTWSAREIVQFDVSRFRSSGTFLVLTYDSPAQEGIDAFKSTFNPKFKDWKLTQISNILVFAAPGTTPQLATDINSHLTQFLVAPYRSFIPTATPGLRN